MKVKSTDIFFLAQVFGEPSRFGIAEGKISRLCISKRDSFGLKDCLVNYDRGWDGGPPRGELRVVVEKIVRYFDHKTVDWTFEEQR